MDDAACADRIEDNPFQESPRPAEAGASSAGGRASGTAFDRPPGSNRSRQSLHSPDVAIPRAAAAGTTKPAPHGDHRDAMTAMIEIEGLTKRFGAVTAVDDVSFTVRQGEVLGFLGPNGAGKSTTMKMAAGFLTPSAGTARLAGIDVLDRPLEAKRRLGYLPEGAPTYPDMTVLSFLRFVAGVRGFRGASVAARVERAVGLADLSSVLLAPIDTLSKGFKRRVGLAQALLHDPEVLILDEPTDGLDPNQKHQVRALIASMAKDKAIVISTHILEEVEAICTRAVVIAKGRVLADETPEALARRSRWHDAVAVRVEGVGPVALGAALGTVPGVLNTSDGPGGSVVAFPRPGTQVAPAIAELLKARGWRAAELRVERGRLDEVFRDITQGQELLPAPKPVLPPELAA